MVSKRTSLLVVIAYVLCWFNIAESWDITAEQITKPDKAYDCKHMVSVCNMRPCNHFARAIGKLPTESIFIDGKFNENNAKPNLKIEIKGWNHHDDMILCVSDDFFQVAKSMLAIIKSGAMLDIAELKPSETSSTSKWVVESLTDESQKGKDENCEETDVCKTNLKSCVIGNNYPFLKVTEKDSAAYDKLAECDDKGKFDGHECDKVVCASTRNQQTDETQVGIIRCGTLHYASPIYYHSQSSKWCLSRIDDEMQTDGNEKRTLKDELAKQGTEKTEIDHIIRRMDPSVTGIHYYADAKDKIFKFPSEKIKQLQDRGILDFEKSIKFSDLPTGEQEMFEKIRFCKYSVICRNKIVLPWDILQLMVDMGWMKSANADRRDTDVETQKGPPAEEVNRELNEAEKKNNGLSLSEIKQAIVPEDPVESKEEEADKESKKKTKKNLLQKLLNSSNTKSLHTLTITKFLCALIAVFIGVGAFFIYMQ